MRPEFFAFIAYLFPYSQDAFVPCKRLDLFPFLGAFSVIIRFFSILNKVHFIHHFTPRLAVAILIIVHQRTLPILCSAPGYLVSRKITCVPERLPMFSLFP